VTEAVAAAARRHGMVVVLGVNERDHGSLYNAQLIFDADGRLVLKRRKITPTFHERMIWGQGDGSGLRVVDTAVGRIGALACWEHYNPLARYALMAQHEEIHVAQFPGSMVGPIFADQIVSPEGAHVVPPLTQGEGILVADLDLGLIVKRKRMMDSVGHYARPELLHLVLDDRPARPMELQAPAAAAALPSGSASDEADSADSHADRAADQRVAVLRGPAR
jgi:aliphatic nitrilase